jgi:hypothetical protein
MVSDKLSLQPYSSSPTPFVTLCAVVRAERRRLVLPQTPRGRLNLPSEIPGLMTSALIQRMPSVSICATPSATRISPATSSRSLQCKLQCALGLSLSPVLALVITPDYCKPSLKLVLLGTLLFSLVRDARRDSRWLSAAGRQHSLRRALVRRDTCAFSPQRLRHAKILHVALPVSLLIPTLGACSIASLTAFALNPLFVRRCSRSCPIWPCDHQSRYVLCPLCLSIPPPFSFASAHRDSRAMVSQAWFSSESGCYPRLPASSSPISLHFYRPRMQHAVPDSLSSSVSGPRRAGVDLTACTTLIVSFAARSASSSRALIWSFSLRSHAWHHDTHTLTCRCTAALGLVTVCVLYMCVDCTGLAQMIVLAVVTSGV